jgi:DNA-binding MarR family transcriptional regulator
MAVKFEAENLILTTWLMIHRADALLKICEDKVFGEYKLNAERYAVLVTIQYFGGSAKPSEVARWLQRSPNTISMLADRMVSSGLIKRSRDKRDRRVVHLTISDKGKEALKPATQAGWEFIQEILSSLSYEDKSTLISLLKMINYKSLEYLNPRADIKGMLRDEDKNHDSLMERLVEYLSPLTPEAKHQGGEKKKTIGRG